ncbi:hypothetical protein A5906_24125 [Bradyrhizobium sacchari]|uniref:Uncharacterized protein n=1 Tax=Bradyrhizobium sacchari TaxID=1399419 RepID=A0A560K616_9BRAD|nr:hypothetical protein [Bradyrhizobium sacchari]OPZ00021.1 hypothetical protein A5906_24125 [Bradyrhizobium sacchari]TWB53981.1 hypothetical protein FBZ94_108268 [Bradyrhizobium sacchari]TWB78429.1 hypothetical protein FBZ95_103268 [Bradyrhizobium sacchari]
MKWLKCYAIGFVVATFALTAMQSYSRPGQDQRTAAVIAMAAVWPITAAVVLGGSIGEVASDGWDAEITAARLEKQNATSRQ